MTRTSGWILAGSLLIAATLVTISTGCKPSIAIKKGAVVDGGQKTDSAPLNPATLGTVSGTIHLEGKAPERIKIDMSQDPACAMSGGSDNYSEQYVAHDGKLANVYLYIKVGPTAAFTATGPSNPIPVIMDQKGCRYTPHVIALYKGGSVEFRNSDSTMHNVHIMPATVGGKQLDVSQATKGQPQVVPFNDTAIMMPVRCNNHPWMNAFINVSDTPFYAVSDPDGHFEIKGLPAGRYELAAVHEKLGVQTMSVIVKPQETIVADFKFIAK
jgi:plastocyanin